VAKPKRAKKKKLANFHRGRAWLTPRTACRHATINSGITIRRGYRTDANDSPYNIDAHLEITGGTVSRSVTLDFSAFDPADRNCVLRQADTLLSEVQRFRDALADAIVWVEGPGQKEQTG